MGTFSIWHWLIVLLIIALVFGTKKLRNLGEDLGGAVRGFKAGLKEGDEEAKAQKAETRRVQDETIDVQAREKSTNT